MSNTPSNQLQPQAGPLNLHINTLLTQHNKQPLSNLSNNNLQTTNYWTIATRNVRGLTEKTKRELWFQYCYQQNWDIVVSTETNGTTQSSKFWNTPNYKSWWSHGLNKIGQGICLSLTHNLAQRVFKVQEWEGRTIAVDLSFGRKRYLRIIGLYYPAASGNQRKLTYNRVTQLATEASQKDWHTIILGDFNAVSNPSLDKHDPTKLIHSFTPTSKLITHLINHGFVDTYRETNPYKKEYTWGNTRNCKSRLDQIWISIQQTWNIRDATIDQNTNPTIISDHKATICRVENWQLDNTAMPTHHKPNNRYHWGDTSEKQWEKFAIYVDGKLEKQNYSNPSPNQSWNYLKEALFQGVEKFIKKIKKHRKPGKGNNQALVPRKIILVQRLVQRCNRHKTNPTQSDELIQEIRLLATQAAELFKEFPTLSSLPGLANDTTTFKVWHQQVKNFLIVHRSAFQAITNFKQKQAMANFITRRHSFLEHNKKAMIQSILDSPKRSICLDKIITQEQHPQVITDPTEIKHLVQRHFSQWTAKRNVKDLENYPEWKEEYSPIKTVDPNWYKQSLQPFTTEEIKRVINTRSNSSAPGPSQIPYIVFKKLGPKATNHITKLFNNILRTGETPEDWSKGSIYPIPKPKVWENNLNHTRPITLLKTCRKIFTKCITNRITEVLKTHTILSPLNWAALSGCSTQEPIYIIQNIIEHAKENAQQAWILSQDISKAYDSINIEMLYKALQRIQIPPQLIVIILSLFENRENSVITLYGNTAEYKVKDDIDQEDTISFLIWRIYYDPLLTRVSRLHTGYTIIS